MGAKPRPIAPPSWGRSPDEGEGAKRPTHATDVHARKGIGAKRQREQHNIRASGSAPVDPTDKGLSSHGNGDTTKRTPSVDVVIVGSV